MAQRPGWALITSVGVLISAGAPLGWSLGRQRRTQSAHSLTDNTSAPVLTRRPAGSSAGPAALAIPGSVW